MQSIADTFLYIPRAIYLTMFVALSIIGAKQASPTTDTIQKTKMLMDYATTQPDTVIRFHASIMCLHMDRDAAYLVQPKACSRAAGYFYLSNNPPPDNIGPTLYPLGPILTKCQTICNVMDSAAAAETGTIYSMASGPYPPLL